MQLPSITFLSVTLLALLDWISGHEQGASHHGIDRNAIHDEGHIKEHLDGKVNLDQKMTEEEMQFHYFKQHDYDDNSLLDGLEIIKAIYHVHKDDNDTKSTRPTDAELSSQTDVIMMEYDLNLDGYIDYGEYISSVRKHMPKQ